MNASHRSDGAQPRPDSRPRSVVCTLGHLAEVLLDLGLTLDQANHTMIDLLASGAILTATDGDALDRPPVH